MSRDGQKCSAAVMTYVSPSTSHFYLSRDALVQLDVIPFNFPRFGAVIHQSSVQNQPDQCACSKRTKPPLHPHVLPFKCVLENNGKMCDWLVYRYSTSTFNQCTYQQLPGMTGPAISFHVDKDAKPRAVHTPATVPLYWQESVKEQLDNDVALGVLEKVPIGEPSRWCHRVVITAKADGTPRRTVDLSPLNAFCLRETHHVQPPYQQAKKHLQTPA